MRVVMLSAGGAMAEAALNRLVEADRAPVALIVHQNISGAQLPVRPQSALSHLAQANGVAVLTSSTDQTLVEYCRTLMPDLLLSVCFSRRISAAVADAARIATLNAHPSALPAWRGPDPVFWQLRQGCETIGVTLHRVVDRIDGGPALSRTDIDITEAVSEFEIDVAAGRAASDMLVHWIDSGASTSADVGHRCATGRWWRQPRDEDYRIFPAWRCAHAERFMRILALRKRPFYWVTKKDDVVIREPANAGSRGDVEIHLSDGSLGCWRLEPAKQR